MNHNLSRVYTAHYRYSGPDRVDITVKGQDPNWKEFAPTWDMVMSHKRGSITDDQYISRYLSILDLVSSTTWGRLLHMSEATFVCFCPEEAFCHRNILVNYIVQSMGDRIGYGGWRR